MLMRKRDKVREKRSGRFRGRKKVVAGLDSSLDQSQRIDGQIVTDSEEEGETDDEGEVYDGDKKYNLLCTGGVQLINYYEMKMKVKNRGFDGEVEEQRKRMCISESIPDAVVYLKSVVKTIHVNSELIGWSEAIGAEMGAIKTEEEEKRSCSKLDQSGHRINSHPSSDTIYDAQLKELEEGQEKLYQRLQIEITKRDATTLKFQEQLDEIQTGMNANFERISNILDAIQLQLISVTEDNSIFGDPPPGFGFGSEVEGMDKDDVVLVAEDASDEVLEIQDKETLEQEENVKHWEDSMDVTNENLVLQTQKVFDEITERETVPWNEGHRESKTYELFTHQNTTLVCSSIYCEEALGLEQTNPVLKILRRFEVMLDIKKVRENSILFPKIRVSDLGLIAREMPTYDIVPGFLLPLTTHLPLYGVDISHVLWSTGARLLTFSLGLVTTMVGILVAFFLVCARSFGQNGLKNVAALMERHMSVAVNHVDISIVLATSSSVWLIQQNSELSHSGNDERRMKECKMMELLSRSGVPDTHVKIKWIVWKSSMLLKLIDLVGKWTEHKRVINLVFHLVKIEQMSLSMYISKLACVVALDFRDGLPFYLGVLEIHKIYLGYNSAEVDHDNSIFGVVHARLERHKSTLEQNHISQEVLKNWRCGVDSICAQIDAAYILMAYGICDETLNSLDEVVQQIAKICEERAMIFSSLVISLSYQDIGAMICLEIRSGILENKKRSSPIFEKNGIEITMEYESVSEIERKTSSLAHALAMLEKLPHHQHSRRNNTTKMDWLLLSSWKVDEAKQNFMEVMLSKEKHERSTVAAEKCVLSFSISGFKSVEIFFGVCVSRVPDIFGKEKETIACMVFLHEIDDVGCLRGKSTDRGNDAREQTLNQMSTETDVLTWIFPANNPTMISKQQILDIIVGGFSGRVADEVIYCEPNHLICSMLVDAYGVVGKLDITSFLSRMIGASATLQWVEDCMVSTKWWIHVQSSTEEGRLVPPTVSACWFSEDKGTFSVGSIPLSPHTLQEISTPTVTCHILESALFFKQIMNGQLVLLSNDVTLKIKAIYWWKEKKSNLLYQEDEEFVKKKFSTIDSRG
ncbi:hypothetical protein C2S53_017472 [Perilla frutescens var. hirtella]|uniref:Uncharacterized protein n=1 Tax=Perilla frutescens var. hirtella TaxID=608512 RepID=A0AAD4IMF0_PERFH|nr:hypothetical protein C2S53_017472 [Perilla frutescens var. hirtella]